VFHLVWSWLTAVVLKLERDIVIYTAIFKIYFFINYNIDGRDINEVASQ
jgi:hypothetical protein